MTVKIASNGFGCIGNHNPHSSNDNSTQTHIVNDCIVRVLSWYDNEPAVRATQPLRSPSCFRP